VSAHRLRHFGMIDAALVTSQAIGLQGQMWLHAAAAGS
jgi:hypothetical protein